MTGETIAHLAGLEVAYAAFRRLPARARPTRDGMTADQRFFQAWRTAYVSRSCAPCCSPMPTRPAGNAR
ncbi:hypothetical protein MNO14_13480 [Luteimonas sp. S4-F44]|uniref:hypothetical protein n=1 Tax=Luteimonas sp. S4-F44 TaxID=2925842 RepID=UPI001F53603B|nr:hypothetical protein [Luteimonas sp. S4-F44]UNK41952.1 hypothetical protein MNO14_13480 [Luteimonas sp. S4-F44]